MIRTLFFSTLTLLLTLPAAPSPGQELSLVEGLEIVRIDPEANGEILIELLNVSGKTVVAYEVEQRHPTGGAAVRTGSDSFPGAVRRPERRSSRMLAPMAAVERSVSAQPTWPGKSLRVVAVTYDDGTFEGEPNVLAEIFTRRAREVREWSRRLEALERGAQEPMGDPEAIGVSVDLLRRSEIDSLRSQIARAALYIPAVFLDEGLVVKGFGVTDQAISACSIDTVVARNEPPTCPFNWTENWTVQCSSGLQQDLRVNAIGRCHMFMDCRPSFRTDKEGPSGDKYVFKRSGAIMNVRTKWSVPVGCSAEDWAPGTVECSCPTAQQDPSTETDGGCPDAPGCTPILIDTLGDGFELTSAAQGVSFDLDADGQPEPLSWTAAEGDEAFLALDRDGDGVIRSGTELFGDMTEQPARAARNGFHALAVFDRPETGGNGDGWIGPEDEVFARLLLWRDANHDGLSQAAELTPLGNGPVQAIRLQYVETRRRDRHGNLLHWMAPVESTGSRRLQAIDVSFVSPTAASRPHVTQIP